MSQESKVYGFQQPLNYPGALEILFIGLKLSHIIFWSWWWVLSPTWIVVLFALAAALPGKKA